MNNTHQELVDEKVVEYISNFCHGDEDNTEEIDWITQTLQDTIDTVMAEEKERCTRIAWEYTVKALKNESASLLKLREAVDKTPPNKV